MNVIRVAVPAVLVTGALAVGLIATTRSAPIDTYRHPPGVEIVGDKKFCVIAVGSTCKLEYDPAEDAFTAYAAWRTVVVR